MELCLKLNLLLFCPTQRKPLNFTWLLPHLDKFMVFQPSILLLTQTSLSLQWGYALNKTTATWKYYDLKCMERKQCNGDGTWQQHPVGVVVVDELVQSCGSFFPPGIGQEDCSRYSPARRQNPKSGVHQWPFTVSSEIQGSPLEAGNYQYLHCWISEWPVNIIFFFLFFFFFSFCFLW